MPTDNLHGIIVFLRRLVLRVGLVGLLGGGIRGHAIRLVQGLEPPVELLGEHLGHVRPGDAGGGHQGLGRRAGGDGAEGLARQQFLLVLPQLLDVEGIRVDRRGWLANGVGQKQLDSGHIAGQGRLGQLGDDRGDHLFGDGFGDGPAEGGGAAGERVARPEPIVRREAPLRVAALGGRRGGFGGRVGLIAAGLLRHGADLRRERR